MQVFNCGGFGMEAVFFIVVAYARTAFAATLALTFGVAFSGFAISGRSEGREWRGVGQNACCSTKSYLPFHYAYLRFV